MVRISNIEGKLAYLRSTLKKLERYKSLSSAELVNDQDKKGAVERYLYLAAQSAIDAAEMYCKLKKLGKPESMSDSLELLHSSRVIDDVLVKSLIKMVGFRNILAHGYEIVDYRVVENVLKVHLNDLELLARALEHNLSDPN